MNYNRINTRRKAVFGPLLVWCLFVSRPDMFAWRMFLEYLFGHFLSAVQNSTLVLSGSINVLDFSSKFHLTPSLNSKF